MKKEEKKVSRKSLLEWVRELLSRHESELTEIPPLPSEETVERLIDRAIGEKDSPNPDNDDKRCSCPYAIRKNIVESLEEVRRFAEKHELAAAVVKALLTLLAEIALGAMKGKVGEKALEALLKALCYSRHIDEAYLRGKNETIIREHFPESPEIPCLGGMNRPDSEDNNIFTIAQEARR